MMDTLLQHARALREEVIPLCQRLVRIPSENPGPGTEAMAQAVIAALDHPAIAVQRLEPKPGAVSVVATVRGANPGPRVVLNGHLDTFPIGPTQGWSLPPLSGERVSDRIYGRGAGDMKAGVAILIQVVRALADRRADVHGELVLTLCADEEAGGTWGTEWLLANVPAARGDYVLNADAGHPRVVRYGEKGLLWLRLEAIGRAGHGAHTHLGDNALEQLMMALQGLLRLRTRAVDLPDELRMSLAEAREVSEQEGGAGEYDNLRSITVNVGTVQGGSVPNLVPGFASAAVDLRYPPGISREQLLAWVDEALATARNVSRHFIPGADTLPAWTAPSHPLVQTVLKHARRLAAADAVPNMRVGLTDTRLFRLAGMPAVVYGPRALNMGGADEHVLVDDLRQVFEVHLATAAELLGVRST
jgi:succinyl-diaminopimelate desuccinylase